MKRSSVERVVFLAIGQERERCAKIAASLEFEQAPDDYQVTAPGLEGLCEDWERQQGYHADRIAREIRG